MSNSAPHFNNLKPWQVCRLTGRFVDLASANAYAAAHGARFVLVMPETNGEASIWELENHYEREATARALLATLEATAPAGVIYAAFRESNPRLCHAARGQ